MSEAHVEQRDARWERGGEETDSQIMRRTFALALEAGTAGYRPFATILIAPGAPRLEVVSDASLLRDPTAHPEVVALRIFAARHGRSALADATLYTNVEPCPMCAGAIFYAGVMRLVFGVSRERFDAHVAHIRGRERRMYQGCRHIVTEGGRVAVSGPLLESEGMAVLTGASLRVHGGDGVGR